MFGHDRAAAFLMLVGLGALAGANALAETEDRTDSGISGPP